MLQRHAKDYTRVAKAAADAIRAHDSQRLVVTDGYPGGGSPIPELFATGMLQSGHTYNPMQVTHHDCEWVPGGGVAIDKVPTWPLKDDEGNIICDRQKLEKDFHPWAGLAAQSMPIHFGEMGSYKHTSPDVVLAWFNDTLDVLSELNSGWALWNFRGPFGVLDTERPGNQMRALERAQTGSNAAHALAEKIEGIVETYATLVSFRSPRRLTNESFRA